MLLLLLLLLLLCVVCVYVSVCVCVCVCSESFSFRYLHSLLIAHHTFFSDGCKVMDDFVPHLDSLDGQLSLLEERQQKESMDGFLFKMEKGRWKR